MRRSKSMNNTVSRVALVTGGSGGIGSVVVNRLVDVVAREFLTRVNLQDLLTVAGHSTGV
jgi:NAD(P)-dependent dehydrogenase (short-subunit alcohol dehydrogenase family)